MLREVMVKIGLEIINTQEEVTVEALLDSRATGLVMSSEFVRKQEFKLRKIENLIYVRNMDRTMNREELIENTMEVNIYYQGHKKRTEIDMIGGQKQNVIMEMPWLAHYNSEIDWITGEVKMMRYLEECEKQWRPKQGKSEQQKQKEEEKKEKAEKKQEEKEEKKKEKKKPKKEKKMKMQKIAEEQEIWDEEEKAAKSEAEAKKLVPEKFHKWIYVFGKKASERMLTRKLWDHAIDIKEGFVPRKRKIYPLL